MQGTSPLIPIFSILEGPSRFALVSPFTSLHFVCDHAVALFWRILLIHACWIPFSNALFFFYQLLKPSLVKTKALSLFPPNLRQGKQNHTCFNAEYFSHGLPQFQSAVNVCVQSGQSDIWGKIGWTATVLRCSNMFILSHSCTMNADWGEKHASEVLKTKKGLFFREKHATTIHKET